MEEKHMEQIRNFRNFFSFLMEENEMNGKTLKQRLIDAGYPESEMYNPNVEKYVTCDAAGTLCVYNVDRAESMSLAEKARRAKKEWSDFLEKGKALADSHFDGNNEILSHLEPSYEFCRNNYMQEGWVNTKILR